MFLPLGDYPNPRSPQWVTRILLGLNIAVHLLVAMPLSGRGLDEEDLRDPEVLALLDTMWENQAPHWIRQGIDQRTWALKVVSQYDLVTQRYGYKPGRPSLASLFACMFLHGSFLHLAGNMLYLWIFGDNVEARLGRLRYAGVYLGTGVVATLAFAAFKTESTVPLVGASGAISGVLGLYFLWFPNNQIRVLLFFVFIMFIHVRAVWVLGAYLVIDNLLPFLTQQSTGLGGNVAYGAHLGGFVAGMIVAWVFNQIRGAPARPGAGAYERVRTVRWNDPRLREQMVHAMENPAHTFDRAIAQGQMEEAAHAFSRIIREGGVPPEPGHVFQLARWLYESDLVDDAAAVFRYYIRSYPTGADLDRVHLGLGILLARRLGQPTPAREHLLAAIDLAGDDPGIRDRAREELDRLGA